MDFKAPFFFLAFVCLSIPIIIHLFNLRKYKKVYFPSLRMLEEMMVKNKKLSKIQKWALFLSRLLAVFFLVFAFAHPYFSSKNISKHAGKIVMYIDNSMSTTYQIGQKTILDELKETAIQWLTDENINELIILTNESLNNYTSFDKTNAIDYIKTIQAVPYSSSYINLYNSLQHIKTQSESEISAVIISDHQTIFYPNEIPKQEDGIQLFSLYSLNTAELENVYIDTCYFIQTPMDTENGVEIVTELRKIGQKEHTIDLAYMINGQSIANKSIAFNTNDTLLIDTQAIHLKSIDDNHIHVGFLSKELSFDDNYYISARLSNQLKVGIINDGAINPQLTQAFNSSRKIFPEQFSTISDIQNPSEYSLIFYNNVKKLSDSDVEIIKKQLENGSSFAISIDKNANISSIKLALESIGNINIFGIDTIPQNIADIEINHPLIRDVIVQKPDNIQLPLVNFRYKYSSTLSARPQDVMKYRDGSGFITQFNIQKGILYLFSSPIDLVSNNFTQSYYFAPIIYKMSTNSRHSEVQVYEISEGKNAWLNTPFEENTILHLVKNDYKNIPVQRKEGNGTLVTLPPTLQSDSFYHIQDNTGKVLIDIALNYDRNESVLKYLNDNELKEKFDIERIKVSIIHSNFEQNKFLDDLWKWVLGIVLIALIVETYFLLSKSKN